MSNNRRQKEVGSSFSIRWAMTRNEMANLGEAVDEKEDAVGSVRNGQVGHEVEPNRRKRTIRNREGLQEASRFPARNLGSRAGIARPNVRLDLTYATRPGHQ